MKKNKLPRAILRFLFVVAGTLVGMAVGFYTMLAIVVIKARAGHYIFSLDDILGFNIESTVFVLGMLAGAFLGYRMPLRLVQAVLRGLVGLVGGVLVGMLLGLVLGGSREWMWSGAIVVSALALVVVMALVLLRSRREALTRGDLIAASIVGGAVLVTFIIGLQAPPAVEVPTIEPSPLPVPSEVDEVVFIVGDGGATEAERTPLLRALQHDVEHWSAAVARDSAVSIVYPGDLVYPVGVRDRSHPLFPQDSSRLWNQIELVGGPEARRHRSVGLFIPGNHDWGNTNDERGLDRIINLADQLALARAAGYAVELFPKAGLPGPAVRDVRSNIRFIFLDTHWFLRSTDASLQDAFLADLEEALNNAGDRHVIIATHHPYQSAGPHGAIVPGYKSWGIEYLLRRSGAIVQDLNSAIYRDLLEGMQAIFARAERPPLVFAGGHDHSLQVIERQQESDPAFMLVSGAGSKVSAISTMPGMHYGAGRPGYMKLIFRKDDAVDLFVVAGEPELLKCTGETDAALATCMTTGENAFDIVYGQTIAAAPDVPIFADSTAAAAAQNPETPETADAPTVVNVNAEAPMEPPSYLGRTAWWTRTTIPATDEIAESDEDRPTPPPAVPARVLYFRPDSVVTTTGASYNAGRLHRIVLGDLNRHLWDVPVRLPVLNLDTLAGGIAVDELTGGMQTLGLRMDGPNGVTYQFRSIVKDASRALDNEIKRTAEGLLNDQLAAQFPLAAMVVAELLQAVDVLVARPTPVVMPNDDRLGPYRPYFAGRVGWIEVRPNEGEDDGPGFAGSRKVVGGDEIYEELREDPDSYMDPQKYLRTRFVDFLVSDWDRHADNWRWARFDDDDGRRRWEPIPRDRDWAFTRTGGLVSTVSPVVFSRFVGISSEYPPMDRLTASGRPVDLRMLAAVPRETFEAEARWVQDTLTDAVLLEALSVLPPAYQAIEQDRLFEELRTRRGYLVRMAGDLYDLLAETVHVYGYDGEVDTVRLTPEGSGIRVRAWIAGREDAPYFDRLIDPAATQELHLYLTDDDVVEQPDDLPVTVKIIDPDDEA